MRALRQHDRSGIRAHMAGDAGKHVDARVRMHMKVESRLPTSFWSRIRRQRETGRRQVRSDRCREDRWCMIGLPTNTASSTSCRSILASAVTCPMRALIASRTAVGHFRIAARVHHHIGDAAHKVFTEADLRVHQAGRRNHLAGPELAQMGSNGGGADVESDAIDRVVEARPDRDDPVAGTDVAVIDGDGHLPLAGAQGTFCRSCRVRRSV